MSATMMRMTGRSMLWPSIPPGITLPLVGSATVLNSAAQIYATQGLVYWPDRGTHDIQSVEYWNGDGLPGTGNTVRVSLQDVDLTVSPPRPDGVVDQFATATNPTANGLKKLTLNTPRLAVAHGTPLAVVYDITVLGTGLDWRPMSWGNLDGRSIDRWHEAYYNGSTWAAQGRTPAVLFRSSDGSVGTLGPFFPVTGFSTVETFNSTSTPDERGLEFVPIGVWEIDALWALCTPAASTDPNFELVLYENSVAVRTASLDPHTWGAFTATMTTAPITPYTLSPANTYRVVVKPSTANVTLAVPTIDAADIRQLHFGTSAGYASRTDGGSWAARVDTKVPMCGVRISGMIAGAPLPGQHIRFV